MIEVYIDGASSGNPGPSGAGIFIKGHGTGDQYSIPLGEMDNHEAEFTAFLHAIKICIDNKYSVVSFRTDSQLVSQAVEKRFVKKEIFSSIFNEAIQLIDNHFDLFFIKWIPSSQNSVADKLARQAIQQN